MGLDIYVSWPDMTEEEKNARYTGFQNAGKAGYLRQSWGSLRAWDEVCQAIFSESFTALIYPKWAGSNDGLGPDMKNMDERKRLEQTIDKLEKFINETPDDSAVLPDSARGYFKDWDKRIQIIKDEFQEVIDFLKLALSKEGSEIKFS